MASIPSHQWGSWPGGSPAYFLHGTPNHPAIHAFYLNHAVRAQVTFHDAVERELRNYET
jgi:hypothetical protein